MSAPAWFELWDESDNSMWEARSPYIDHSWKLQQRLVNNKIEWYEASDSKLVPDTEVPRTWESLEAAKAAIAKDHADICETH